MLLAELEEEPERQQVCWQVGMPRANVAVGVWAGWMGGIWERSSAAIGEDVQSEKIRHTLCAQETIS